MASWICDRAGSWRPCPDGYFNAVRSDPTLFGFEAADFEQVRKMLEEGKDGQRVEEAWFQKLYASIPYDAREPALLGCVTVEETRRGALLVTFWLEGRAVHERLRAWLAGRGFDPGREVLLWEWRDRLAPWAGQTVGSLLAGAQLSADPDRAQACPKCGAGFSPDELVGRTMQDGGFRCAGCGTWLA